MNIEEFRRRKTELEKKISKEISSFHEETGVPITDLYLEVLEVVGEEISGYNATVVIEL